MCTITKQIKAIFWHCKLKQRNLHDRKAIQAYVLKALRENACNTRLCKCCCRQSHGCVTGVRSREKARQQESLSRPAPVLGSGDGEAFGRWQESGGDVEWYRVWNMSLRCGLAKQCLVGDNKDFDRDAQIGRRASTGCRAKGVCLYVRILFRRRVAEFSDEMKIIKDCGWGNEKDADFQLAINWFIFLVLLRDGNLFL